MFYVGGVDGGELLFVCVCGCYICGVLVCGLVGGVDGDCVGGLCCYCVFGVVVDVYYGGVGV